MLPMQARQIDTPSELTCSLASSRTIEENYENFLSDINSSGIISSLRAHLIAATLWFPSQTIKPRKRAEINSIKPVN